MSEGGVSGLEVFSGTGRGRSWSPEAKERIVAESYAPGSSVSAVARRYAIMPTQLFAWCRDARQALRGEPEASLARITVDAPQSGTMVEVEYGGAVVRTGPGVQVSRTLDPFNGVL